MNGIYGKCGLLAVLAVGQAASAVVTTYFNDGFDAYLAGSSILSNSPGWSLSGDSVPGGSVATATVSTDAYVSSGHSLKLTTTTSESLLRPRWNRSLPSTGASVATPMRLAAISFDFNYNYDNSLSEPQDLPPKGFVQDEWIYVRNPANQVVGQIRLNGGYSDWRFGTNYALGSSSASVRNSNWHNVDIVFDFSGQTATYYLNNVRQYTESVSGLLNGSTGLSVLTFENGINGAVGVQSNTNYVDNVAYWADLAPQASASNRFDAAAFDAGDLSINNGNGWKTYDNSANYLSDSESYVMRSYNQMYRATGDTKYLNKLIDHADSVLARRDDFATLPHEEPGNLPIWSTPQYGLVSAPLTDGMIVQAMAQFARIVHEDPALASNPTYSAKAATYIQRIQETLTWLDANYLRSTGSGRSSYSAYPDVFSPDATHVDATLGSILLDLYHATGEASKLTTANRLARQIQVAGFYTTDESNLAWRYDYSQPDAEDISHGAHAAPFLARMAAEGRTITRAQAKLLAESIIEEAYSGNGAVQSGMDGTSPIEDRFGPLPPSYWSWGMAGGMIDLAQFDLRLLPLAREVQLNQFGTSPGGSGTALLGMAMLARYNNVPQQAELSLSIDANGTTYRTAGPAIATLSGDFQLTLVNQQNSSDVQHVTVSLGGEGDEWTKLWQLQVLLNASGAPLLQSGDATLSLSFLDGLDVLKQILGTSGTPGFSADLSSLGDRITLSGALGASTLFTLNAGEASFDLPGDADWDGDVDLSDLSRLAANYSAAMGMSWAEGDFDRDGDVDLSDLSSLAANYGAGQAQAIADFQALSAGAIPEPAGGAVALVTGAILSGRRIRQGGARCRKGVPS